MKTSKKIILFTIIVIAFAALMFIGSKGWSEFVVPNLGKISQFSLPLLLGFSILAGAVSFFSPCAFALFPGYAAFYMGTENEKKEHPAKLGSMASLGVITFFVLLSAIFIFLGKGVTKYLGYLAPAIGVILVILGLILFSGYAFKSGLIQKGLDKLKSKDTRSKRNMYLFGFGYGAVSIGCTLPLLFAMVIVPLTAGKTLTVFLSLFVYAVSMSVFMILVTYMVSWSEDKIIKKMVSSTGTIKKYSGIVLMIIGGYLVYFNIFYSMLL